MTTKNDDFECAVCRDRGLYDTNGEGPFDCYECGKKAPSQEPSARCASMIRELSEMADLVSLHEGEVTAQDKESLALLLHRAALVIRDQSPRIEDRAAGDVEGQREAFEAWAAPRGILLFRRPENDGPIGHKMVYAEAYTRHAFDAFCGGFVAQAALASATPTPVIGWLLRFNDPDPQYEFELGAKCPDGWIGQAEPVGLMNIPCPRCEGNTDRDHNSYECHSCRMLWPMVSPDATPSAAVGEDKSAYWAAIIDDGDIDHIYNADDGSGGEAARAEMNGWINDRLLNDKVLLHLVPLYTAPTKPGHMVEGETEKLLSVLLHVREQLGRANHEIGQFRFGGGAERLENGQKIVSDLYAELRYGKHADMLNATQGGKGEGE